MLSFHPEWRDPSSCSDPMGGVKNLQVVDPTFSSLKVRWDPAVGNVRSYKVFYTADPDGETEEVGSLSVLLSFYYSPEWDRVMLTSHWTGGGVRRHHQHHAEEPGSWHRLRCGCSSHLPRRGGNPTGWEGKDQWVSHMIKRAHLPGVCVCFCLSDKTNPDLIQHWANPLCVGHCGTEQDLWLHSKKLSNICYLWPFVLSEAVVETEVLLSSAAEVPLEPLWPSWKHVGKRLLCIRFRAFCIMILFWRSFIIAIKLPLSVLQHSDAAFCSHLHFLWLSKKIRPIRKWQEV